MPINVPDSLPAVETLTEENIFVMTESRAIQQDIRPLRIAIMNLMPKKIETETHLLRLLSNSPLQVNVQLLHPATHVSRHTSKEHLEGFYKTFDQIQNEKFDGLIVTGAPVETLQFEEVDYWQEMTRLFDWARHHVFSTMYICWAAQAGLYYHHGIQKYRVNQKISGIFSHRLLDRTIPLVRGFDDVFEAPHSRHTEILQEEIENIQDLKIASVSDRAGVYIVLDTTGKNIFVTGHSEYDPLTLKEEYLRDLKKDPAMAVMPHNYFPDNNPEKSPRVCWRSHASLLFSNWLNYYVYQQTPYNINDII